MKNFVKPGHVMTFIAPSGGVVSGVGVVVGSMFFVPAYSAAAGEECEGATVGVFELPKKPADVVTAYGPAYWDGSQLTVTSSGNKKIGVFDAGYAANSTVANVRLDGVSIS